MTASRIDTATPRGEKSGNREVLKRARRVIPAQLPAARNEALICNLLSNKTPCQSRYQWGVKAFGIWHIRLLTPGANLNNHLRPTTQDKPFSVIAILHAVSSAPLPKLQRSRLNIRPAGLRKTLFWIATLQREICFINKYNSPLNTLITQRFKNKQRHIQNLDMRELNLDANVWIAR